MLSVYVLALVASLATFVSGDLYMQAARGSNNRLDDRNRDRNNGNRLFDSQNNNRGGYNVGKLSYYVGEEVPISWSNQHSSGLYQLKNTEFIIQYACDPLMRDGTTTNTIPDKPSQCLNYDCDRDLEYGRHESYTDYQYCKGSSYNKGLFTANQNLKGDAAIYTRQNPDGTRRGYECPEERDYYPYWRPSIWKDIAVLTNQPNRCDLYKQHSFNVEARAMCTYSNEYWTYELEGYVTGGDKGDLPLTEAECNDATTNTFKYTMGEGDAAVEMTALKWTWETYEPFNIPEPECKQTVTTRTNHHGTPGGRSYYTYTWTVPELPEGAPNKEADYSCCVIRMRYNITTNDYSAWGSDDDLSVGADASLNSDENNPDPDDDPAKVDVWTKFGLTYDDIKQAFDLADQDDDEESLGRGYVFRNNPRPDPFGHVFSYNNGANQRRIKLQLAINTNQFGRTFQDRTHCFQVLPRPDDLAEEGKIKLMTVQGKRGNIVQVYPATEYFFIPEPLQVKPGDYVHFCWTGSNTNPNNNDGQGEAGTDRSNICPLTEAQFTPSMYGDVDKNYAELQAGAVGWAGNNYPNFLEEPTYGFSEYVNYANKRGVTPRLMAGLPLDLLKELCSTRRADADNLFDFGNMEELDGAGVTTCIPPVQVSETGTWNFLCTRNNNFSNRSQKGKLIVSQAATLYVEATNSGGTFTTEGEGQAILVILPNAVEEGDTLQVDVTTWFQIGEESTIVELSGPDGGAFAADTVREGFIELWIPYTPYSMHTPVPYRMGPEDGAEWEEMDEDASIEYEGGTYYAIVPVSDGGFYRINNEVDAGSVIALTVGGLAFGAAVTCVLMKKCRKD